MHSGNRNARSVTVAARAGGIGMRDPLFLSLASSAGARDVDPLLASIVVAAVLRRKTDEAGRDNPANLEIKSLFSLVWQWGILHRLKQC